MRSEKKPKAGTVLRKARRTALAGDGARASALYDLFWEVSATERGMGAVRLSYGLLEWAEVGESYAPALKRMRELQHESASKFEQTGESPWLMEVKAFDDALGSQAALDLTLRLRAATSPHTGRAVVMMWRSLVEAGHEAVVGKTMADLEQYYRRSITMVDVHRREGQWIYPADVVEVALGSFRENVRLLLRVLEASGRDEERAALEQRARTDAESRGFSVVDEESAPRAVR